MMERGDKIYVAGHTGLIGSVLVRELRARGYDNLVLRTHDELDLMRQEQVERLFATERPDHVIFVAGRTAGIYANNTYRAEMLYENLAPQTNVIHSAYISEVRRLIFLGCSSMYPKGSAQPLIEEYLGTGALEPTNEPFAIAKLTGVKMCEAYNRQYGTDFLSIIPTNVYGPGQRYPRWPMGAMVIPSLIRRFHEATANKDARLSIWGTGRPSRDFLFVDDLVEAIVFLMNTDPEPRVLNIGTGRDYTIRELVDILRRVSGYEGEVVFDVSKPDGMLVKLQDVGRIKALGWSHKVELEEGIRRTYEAYVASPRT